jgi:hypothetical protein
MRSKGKGQGRIQNLAMFPNVNTYCVADADLIAKLTSFSLSAFKAPFSGLVAEKLFVVRRGEIDRLPS